MPGDWTNIGDVPLAEGEARGQAPGAPVGLPRKTIEVFPSDRVSLFRIACMAILYGGLLLLYSPYLYGVYLWVLVGLVAFMAAIPFVFPLFLSRRKTVDVDDEGIHTKSRTIAWESITAIRMSRRWRLLPVVLVYGKPKRKLRLVRSLPVLRELLPELLRRRPDVAVKPWTRLAIENPEAALAPSRWAIPLLTLMGLVLVSIPFLIRHAEGLWVLFVPALALMTLQVPTVFLLGPQTGEQPLRQEAHSAIHILLFVVLSCSLFGIPLFVIDAFVALAGVMFFADAVPTAFRVRFGGHCKAAILFLAIAAPLAVYGSQARLAPPGRDITDLLGTGPHGGSLLWSRNGNWAIEILADGNNRETQCAVDMRSLRSVVLPMHPCGQFVWDLDGTCVVRSMREEGQRALWLYRMQDGREIKLSSSGKFSGTWGRCISPAGGLVCWMEWPEPNSPKTTLKVYDVGADKTQDLAARWPDGNEIAWSTCGWVDDRTIDVEGQSPPWDCNAPSQPRRLHVLRVRYPDATTESLTSESRFVNWRLAPDFRQAFASGCGEGGTDKSAYYVDLGSGRSVFLGGEELPTWQGDGRAAYRVRNFAVEGKWLCRFDAGEAKESRLYKLPPETKLAGLSPRGRFAFLVHEGFRLYPASLVEVKTGRQRRLNLSWMSALFFLSDASGRSIWSPDEEHYVVSSFDMARKSVRSVLTAVPDDWRGN